MGQLHTELGKTSTLFHDAVRHVCLVSQHTMKYAFVAHTSFCKNCPIINPPDLPTRRRRTKETEVPLGLLVRTDFSPLSPGGWLGREGKKTGWQVCLFSLQFMPPACALICPGWPTWEGILVISGQRLEPLQRSRAQEGWRMMAALGCRCPDRGTGGGNGKYSGQGMLTSKIICQL